MTEIRRKTKQLATLCFSLFLIRLGFRAFGYDLFYHNPNNPSGISDFIEVALAIWRVWVSAYCMPCGYCSGTGIKVPWGPQPCSLSVPPSGTVMTIFIT
ncbi:hypothetical protein [Aeromonas sp. 600774]|uniref:hypothetical protein n=1 Tax=Aeromonas TaxID=642 RepID=UPI003B9F91AB